MAAKKHFAAVYLLASLLGGFTVPVHAEESVDTWERVVFHLDETANARWALMLARSYLDDTPRAKVVIVAYGPGVDFLMDDATDKRGDTYADAVLSLIGRGVEFRVCAATLGAREIVKDDLIEGVAVVPSGISEIARLQLREGYAYLKP